MPGTKKGGKKAAATNKRIHGKDFYVRIGRLGGQLGHTGGFYANRELARKAGRIGGAISKRGPDRAYGMDTDISKLDLKPNDKFFYKPVES